MLPKMSDICVNAQKTPALRPRVESTLYCVNKLP